MKRNLKLLQINTCCYGSTGTLMLSISKIAQEHELSSYIAYPSSRANKRNIENGISIGSIMERNLHLRLAYYTGRNGCFSTLSTGRFLKKIDKLKPDILHMHNLHNCYINLEMLFNYVKERGIPVIWTLHDCWPFTGQCPHFTAANCYKWKEGCHSCPQYKDYPASRIDRTREMYLLKKKWFTGVKDLWLVSPSRWLAGLAGESFLGGYPIKVINNGIDLSVFKPREAGLRSRYDMEKKIILLGVSEWNRKKGLDTFMRLSKKLDSRFRIMLVGLKNHQIKDLPDNITGIPRTDNQKELAEIYTAADLFLNPTLEDNFPTTNLESLACGTPVITFDTGGSVEVINRFTGRVVKKKEVEELLKEIYSYSKEGKGKYMKERLEEARKYDAKLKFKEYVNLYKEIVQERS